MKSILLIAVVFALSAEASPSGEPWLEDPHDAVQYLIDSLVADEAYEESFPEFVTFSIVYMSGHQEDVPRDYHDIAIRENHLPGSGGDPDTAPVRDRFRVYFNGRLLYYSPLPGFYIPYEDFLQGRTDL